MQEYNFKHVSNKLRQRVEASQEKLQKAKEAERKALTRIKIELGGLIVKAGLGNEDRAVVLGALLHVKKEMESSADGARCREEFRRLGATAFLKKKLEAPGDEVGKVNLPESPKIPDEEVPGFQVDLSAMSSEALAALREIGQQA